jgi:hypothetical protein
MSTETELRRQLAELQHDNQALRDQISGNIPGATAWLQTKAWRQQRALNVLNRRVLSQRFVLRELERLGRGLSREEYLAARNAVPEALRERIDQPA